MLWPVPGPLHPLFGVFLPSAGESDSVGELASGVNDSALELVCGSLPARRPRRNVPGSLGHICDSKDGINGVRLATAATTARGVNPLDCLT